jgi:hypothetical protein
MLDRVIESDAVEQAGGMRPAYWFRLKLTSI